MCPDENHHIQGHYDAGKVQIIRIFVEKCSKKFGIKCRSDKEINEWLNGKFLIIVTNEVIFEARNLQSEPLDRYSYLRYFPVQETNGIFEYVMELKKTVINVQDSFFYQGSWTEQIMQAYRFTRSVSRTRFKDEDN